MLSRADKLSRVAGLTWQERRIVVLTLVLLPTIALSLRLFGFRRVQRALACNELGLNGPAGSRGHSSRPSDVARLVAAVTRHGPFRASCLPVALALGWLLGKQGITTHLRLGVRKYAARLEAHAWIEHQGKPLIDSPEVYERFAMFDRIVSPPA
jgi:hypothetical protein